MVERIEVTISSCHTLAGETCNAALQTYVQVWQSGSKGFMTSGYNATAASASRDCMNDHTTKALACGGDEQNPWVQDCKTEEKVLCSQQVSNLTLGRMVHMA